MGFNLNDVIRDVERAVKKAIKGSKRLTALVKYGKLYLELFEPGLVSTIQEYVLKAKDKALPGADKKAWAIKQIKPALKKAGIPATDQQINLVLEHIVALLPDYLQ